MELMSTNANAASFARLIDEYPSYRTSPLEHVTFGDESIRLRLRRDLTCDTTFSSIPLRTAPGDPAAVLPERLGYNPKLSRSIDAAEILPCYRVLRKE